MVTRRRLSSEGIDETFSRVAEVLYNGDFETMTNDMYDRLYSHPMYLQLQRMLIEDIDRIGRIQLYREIGEFVEKRILNSKGEGYIS